MAKLDLKERNCFTVNEWTVHSIYSVPNMSYVFTCRHPEKPDILFELGIWDIGPIVSVQNNWDRIWPNTSAFADTERDIQILRMAIDRLALEEFWVNYASQDFTIKLGYY